MYTLFFIVHQKTFHDLNLPNNNFITTRENRISVEKSRKVFVERKFISVESSENRYFIRNKEMIKSKSALAGVARCIEFQHENQRVTSVIPSQDT